tara:strand:+ start:878 stop:2503 length:1626 start_codon:yes stop_codon:yes gene_type:complete
MLFAQVQDILNCYVPHNYIAGKILLGDFQSSNLFLNGQLPWQFVNGLFQPINYFYSFFEIEKAFWTKDIIIRLVAYLSCFYFLKRTNNPFFLSAIISCLFSSTMLTTSEGLGIAGFPYLLGILLKTKKLNLKNYIAIALIALNTELYLHGIFIFPLLIILLAIFNYKILFYNVTNIAKVFLTILIFIILSNIPLIYSFVFFGPFQNNEQVRLVPDIYDNLRALIYEIFGIRRQNAYFYFNIFSISLLLIGIILSFYKKHKINLFIIAFIILHSLFTFSVNTEFVNNFRINIGGILNALNINRFDQFYLFLDLIIILSITKMLGEKYRKLIYTLIFFSIIFNQMSPTAIAVAKNKFNYSTFTNQQKEIIKEDYENMKLTTMINNLFKFNKNNVKNNNSIESTYATSTFKSYYKFSEYKYLKSIIKNERTFSIGYDPYIAVVNNINVLGGYYRYYPNSYKNKFQKIILSQINFSDERSNRIFLNGQKLYSFVDNSDNININFDQVKKLGANYIISKYVINNEKLELICNNCNSYENLNLYKFK